MGFIAPTGLVLPSLAMVNVRFDKWLRFHLAVAGAAGSARDHFSRDRSSVAAWVTMARCQTATWRKAARKLSISDLFPIVRRM